MESKRKKRKVLKVSLATPELPKSQETQAEQKSKSSEQSFNAEQLIYRNANLVEALFNSEPWRDIVLPLLEESIRSVSGRFTNGRYYHGEFVKSSKPEGFLRGYQLALEEFHNRLDDFIQAREKLIFSKKQEEVSKSSPFINPFLDEKNDN